MSDDTYNGWVNRETWAVVLWMSNDPGWNEWLEELRANAARGVEYQREAADLLKDNLLEWAGCIADGDFDNVPEYARKMIMDTGSLYRVDWWRVVEPD